MRASGKYLYCVIQAEKPQEFGPLGIGGREDPLTTVHWQNLACVVSASVLDDYPVSREYTMAHHRAIEAVRKHFPALLPVCFNTIAKTEQSIIEKVLRPRYQEFLDLLDWVKDKDEIGVKTYWRAQEPVFKKILEEQPGIRALRDELAKRPPAARYYEQIDLGKQIEAALKSYREREGRRVVEFLKIHAAEARQDPVYGDKWILNASFLVNKSKVAEFVQALETLGAQSDGNLVFKYTPDGAPFHFVEVRITWGEEAHVPHR
ncbi:MAG: GvpL/GvpF family gas vesicle protein [Candidatus Omnitrophica bacterium]|nr:GvpL/GvpF family gas vesicle protein [Candidatus Omnitrophota bacterium]